MGDDGTVLGWHRGGVAATTLHGLFEEDAFRAAVLRWAASHAGVPAPLLGRHEERPDLGKVGAARADGVQRLIGAVPRSHSLKRTHQAVETTALFRSFAK